LSKRDEFPDRIVKLLADRAGHQCSNPGCRIHTIGPAGQDPLGLIRISVAAHITAAAEGGPRFDPNLTSKERKSIENAIHLCASCSRAIDANQGKDWSPEVLYLWKKEHEAFVFDRIANPSRQRSRGSGVALGDSARKIIQRVQQFEDDFLHERDRSFSGSFQLVIERQKVMGDLLKAAMRDLKSELVFFPSGVNKARTTQLAAMAIMRIYRLAGQTTDAGLLFWGSEVASRATQEMDGARAAFQRACEGLREEMKAYLI